MDPPGEDVVEMIADCEVCCRPMCLRYWDTGEGELDVEISSAND